jgi:type IX secretion system PorP/SprF family membrane protein
MIIIQRNITNLLFCIALLLATITANAQVDPHFSQYYANPLYLNPALTGVINDGDYRATAIYRNQWSNISQPYSTTGVSADMATNSKLNLGINILNQAAGDGGYNYLNAALSLAYTGLQLDEKGYQRIIIGMQIGLIARKFDPAKLKFGDQWIAGIGFDPTTATQEIFTKTSSTAFNTGAGIVYYSGNPDNKINVYGGFSAANLTQPADPFMAGNKKNLPIRYTIHGGLKYSINEDASLIPNFIYMQQGNASETMVGAYLQVRANNTVDVMAGVNYRLQDAISPYAGFYINNMTVGVSYDINTSSLGKMVSGSNSVELSLTITGKRPNKIKNYFSLCPRL